MARSTRRLYELQNGLQSFPAMTPPQSLQDVLMKPMNELREGRTDDERKGFIKGDGFMTGFNEARANCAGNRTMPGRAWPIWPVLQ